MSARVTFAGSGDAFGSGGRLQACIVVDVAGSRILLDCGATSLTALKRLGIEPNSIDAVVVSHLHGDHFGGLPFLVLDGQFSRRDTPLRVCGPRGTDGRLRRTMEALFPGSTSVDRKFQVEVTELLPGAAAEPVPGVTLTTFAADHACGAPPLMLRLQGDGTRIAYTGDTAWTPAIMDLAAEADLFVCEGYFPARRVPYHLSYAELLEHEAEFTAKRVVLTHMTAEMIAAEGVRHERAHDGLVIHL